MQNIGKKLGLKIKELRKAKKLTQTQLAEKVGIDYKHLSRIEVGSSFPSINTLGKIAYYLDVEASELFSFGNSRGKSELIQEIYEILNNTDHKNVVKAYNVLKSILK
jgi:transcriptional regulator with XRE-family HTH domain